jgi:hypothetical protein
MRPEQPTLHCHFCKNKCHHWCYNNDIETSKSCANKYQIYPALLGDDAYPIIDLLNNALDKHNAEAKKLQEEKQQIEQNEKGTGNYDDGAENSNPPNIPDAQAACKLIEAGTGITEDYDDDAQNSDDPIAVKQNKKNTTESMEYDDFSSVHDNSSQAISVHTISQVDDVTEKVKVPGDIHVFKKVEGKLIDAPCHTTFLALLSFCHEEKTTKFVAPRVNWRQINKDFVKDLVDGAEKECQSETSLDWKEEIKFTFYEVYHIAEEEEENFDMNLYEPLYSSYKTNTVRDGAECISNKWAGPVRMFTVKKLINLLCIEEDFQDVFNMDEPIDFDENAFVTDPSLLARIIGHEVFKSLKFPTLDLFEKFPQLAIDPSPDMTLTMYNAAKNMRESIQKFQELTSLRVAFIDGQHRGFGTKIMCCGYHIGDASEKRVNYFQVQCYQIKPESPVTRILSANVVLDESGMVVKEQGAVESKRLDTRKKTGVPVTWRSWFNGHMESLYSQYLNTDEDYLRRLWRPAYLTNKIVRQPFLFKSGKFVFDTQIPVFLLFYRVSKVIRKYKGDIM